MTTPKVTPNVAAGGARAGSGRKHGSGPVYEQLAEQRRRLMAAKAALAEIEVRRRSGELLERAAVQVSAMRLHSTMAQFLRSLPDDLERTCGLSPSTVVALELRIDAAGLELARQIEAALRG